MSDLPAPILPLGEVLRRCHRDELVPLASALKLPVGSRGRDAMATAVERTLRAAGAAEIGNLVLRKGEGPPYLEVVAGLARRLGIVPAETAPETERRILAWWRQNGQPRPTERSRIDGLLGMNALERLRDMPPEDVKSPVKVVGSALLLILMRGFLFFLGPVIAMRLIWWLAHPRDAILLPAVLALAELRATVDRRFTVGLLGPPSVGKDAAVKALFGLDTGNVSPIAGSTKTVSIFPIPGADGLEVVNTPGLGDVVQALTEETRGVLDHIDVFIFLVNAQGGVRTREKEEWARCSARRRPVLVVVNKIDTLKVADRERFVADTAVKLGVPREQVVAASFDPLPQLMPAPMGIEPVRAWLVARIAETGRPTRWLSDPAPSGPAAPAASEPPASTS